MRTVLLGTDLMYDSNGNLIPIEINTNVGWSGPDKWEDDSEVLDLSFLSSFLQDGGYTNLIYIGSIRTLSTAFSGMCQTLNITYQEEIVSPSSITVPIVNDSDTTLIIRSSYDTTALVDDTYCADKVNFMNLIATQSFGSQFAYLDSNNNLINNITNILDNGVHPNFILKSRYPSYDKNVYPKLYKVTNQIDLNTILQNVDSNYFLMPFYYNPNQLFQNHIQVIRSLNLLEGSNLTSIPIGEYTMFPVNDVVTINPTYNPTTFELDSSFKTSYLSFNDAMWIPKLLDGDLVEMADGTFKSGSDLQIGDIVKTIDVPNADNTNIADEQANYNIDFATLQSGSTYSVNTVTAKNRVNKLGLIATITFTDNTTWSDVEASTYLTDVNGDIEFVGIGNLVSGNKIILVNTYGSTETGQPVQFIEKEVQSVEVEKSFFGGWEITVQDQHIFLTVSDPTNAIENSVNGIGNYLFAAIEHNVIQCTGCLSCSTLCFQCPKGQHFCNPVPAQKCSSASC
jgi:hypothetical protein